MEMSHHKLSLQQNNETATEEHIVTVESVVVQNTVASNSCRGTMGGLWAKPSAKLLGKDLFYCAYHESTQIMDGGAGLPEELRNQFMRTICIQ
jgi:hypothetical protein